VSVKRRRNCFRLDAGGGGSSGRLARTDTSDRRLTGLARSGVAPWPVRQGPLVTIVLDAIERRVRPPFLFIKDGLCCGVWYRVLVPAVRDAVERPVRPPLQLVPDGLCRRVRYCTLIDVVYGSVAGPAWRPFLVRFSVSSAHRHHTFASDRLEGSDLGEAVWPAAIGDPDSQVPF
jgi:hypothetical protein